MYKYKDKYTIDFTDVQYYIEMHLIIREALDFPDYYGCNLDAFWDCITDMMGDSMHIEILGFDVIERKFGDYGIKFVETLKDVKHYCNDKYINDIKIEIVRGNERTEIK